MDSISIELAEYLVQRLAQFVHPSSHYSSSKVLFWIRPRIQKSHQSSRVPQEERLLVGIAGVPASGKSTLAKLVVNDVNKHLACPTNSDDVAVLVGLDGWHFTRAQLDAFPDPIQAHARRGAHWTFDGEGYVEFMRLLRKPRQLPQNQTSTDSIQVNAVYAPSFLHAIKDPSPNSVSIRPHHRLVVIEGLYTFLSIDPWVKAGQMLDERWWVEISEEDAEKRLVPRHVESGVAKDLAEAIWRARENDAPNGRFIKDNLLEPTKVIITVQDPVYIIHSDK